MVRAAKYFPITIEVSETGEVKAAVRSLSFFPRERTHCNDRNQKHDDNENTCEECLYIAVLADQIPYGEKPAADQQKHRQKDIAHNGIEILPDFFFINGNHLLFLPLRMVVGQLQEYILEADIERL
jgi:hypothetical protein